MGAGQVSVRTNRHAAATAPLSKQRFIRGKAMYGTSQVKKADKELNKRKGGRLHRPPATVDRIEHTISDLFFEFNRTASARSPRT